MPIALLQPPASVLCGPSGTGKTYSASTYIEAGLEVFFLGTEPGACEVVLDAIKSKGLDIAKFKFHQMNVVAPGWDAIMDNAKLVQQMSYETLSKQTGIAKAQMGHFMELLNCLKMFVDDRTGTSHGDVTDLGASCALVIDGLSGINKMAREYTVGYKPTMHQGEWGTAMQLEENLIYKLISDRNCFFTLTSHVDREIDEITGGSRITMAALGRKLAPQLIKYFSEVIYTKREGDKFLWSTSEPNVDTKQRSLPISAKLTPTFVPIVEAHRQRLRQTLAPGAASPQSQSQPQGAASPST